MSEAHHTLIKYTFIFRSLRLNFEGKARVTIVTADGSSRDEEKFLDKEIILFGNSPSGGTDTTELPQGQHQFFFEQRLPRVLPSSLEDNSYNYVMYVVSCTIDEPRKSNYKISNPFTLLGSLDLNSNPSYSQILQSTERKTWSCIWCMSGSITASFYLDRQGYVPGESIRSSAEICNNSNIDVERSYVELIMVVKRSAQAQTQVQKKKIVTLPGSAIPSDSCRQWSGQELVIPSRLKPSFMGCCRIIDISYIVQLRVELPGLRSNLKVPLDIVIGTVPLTSEVQQQPPQPPQPFGLHESFVHATAPPLPQPFGLNESFLHATAPPLPQAEALAPRPITPPPDYNECSPAPLAYSECSPAPPDYSECSPAPLAYSECSPAPPDYSECSPAPLAYSECVTDSGRLTSGPS
ncbi:hypothetical protein RRG08_021659 [Elysia crispata]|uniref:Arrestin C-terminal-like domain-containing protein n=1 Tax=Elysia crispata TaxID=231223 RepID=A0AAE1CJA0_9GAST|nr:hypothetical protein RRG08_021659 [Elysia crispata]